MSCSVDAPSLPRATSAYSAWMPRTARPPCTLPSFARPAAASSDVRSATLPRSIMVRVNAATSARFTPSSTAASATAAICSCAVGSVLARPRSSLGSHVPRGPVDRRTLAPGRLPIDGGLCREGIAGGRSDAHRGSPTAHLLHGGEARLCPHGILAAAWICRFAIARGVEPFSSRLRVLADVSADLKPRFWNWESTRTSRPQRQRDPQSTRSARQRTQLAAPAARGGDVQAPFALLGIHGLLCGLESLAARADPAVPVLRLRGSPDVSIESSLNVPHVVQRDASILPVQGRRLRLLRPCGEFMERDSAGSAGRHARREQAVPPQPFGMWGDRATVLTPTKADHRVPSRALHESAARPTRRRSARTILCTQPQHRQGREPVGAALAVGVRAENR